jgi:(4-(4-[2-(gamma-L-glutamylamino)ethyl]phenoxymethyl)furan-2-yl)methanamine synthase
MAMPKGNVQQAPAGRSTIGWDIGGVNTKVAHVRDGAVTSILGEPFEVQCDPGALAGLLRSLAARAGAPPGATHAVTMTAELSQLFRTKAEGVAAVLDAVEAAFPGADIRVYDVAGRFLSPEEARREPLAVAASNWAATAALVARTVADAVLIDIGTTSTDIIPIEDGRVAAAGRTDPARLASGELVYTGALRTPVEAVLSQVPLWGGEAGVSAEGFALMGDVHLWRGSLEPGDYTVRAPDGRPATREYAGERLARVVCGDRTLLDDAALDGIADAAAAAQVRVVATALGRVLARRSRARVAVVAGLGEFIAAAAAAEQGLQVRRLADELGGAARHAPAAAVALLLDDVRRENGR